MITKVTPIVNKQVIGLCSLSYYGHPNGCPNWNKKCKPTHIFNLKDCYVIYTVFDFGSHVERMKIKHPDWSKRQLECCLYWQGSARKVLREEIDRFKKLFPNYIVDTCPELRGVDVTATMKSIKIELEWPPVNYAYQVAIGGIN